MEKRINLIKNIDYKLLIGIIVLCIFGLVVLSSATLSLDGKNAIMRSQRVATFLGFGVLLVLMIIDYRHWKYLYKLIYIASLMLLVATLIFGRGPTPSSEIRSWISIGGFSFQPSEFVKIAFIISLASYLEEVKEKLNQPLTLFKVLVFPIYRGLEPTPINLYKNPVFLESKTPCSCFKIDDLFIVQYILFE